MSEKFLWVESYSPTTISDCILPTNIKDAFTGYVDTGEFPNLIPEQVLSVWVRPPSSFAMCTELDVDLLFVNASLDRGIGDIRNTVAQFASTSSLMGSKKVVLLDEQTT